MFTRIKTLRRRHRVHRKFLLGLILLFAVTALNSGTYLNGDQAVKDKGHWDLYSEGKFYYKLGFEEDNEKAIQLFRKSIELNNQFAPAYIGLAKCYTEKVNRDWDGKLKWLDMAEDLLEKANALESERPDYYHTLIKVYLTKYTVFAQDTGVVAFKLAEEAIRRYPDLSDITSIAGYCFFLEFGETGKKSAFKKALKLKEKVYNQDILDPGNFVLTELFLLNRDFRRAQEVCNQLRDFEASSVVNSRIGEIYYYSGELKGSKYLFNMIESSRLKGFALEHLGMIAAQEGDKETALQILKSLDTLSVEPLDRHLRRASILMGIGEEEQGFDQLDALFEKSYARKMRHVYYKYMEMDKNFNFNKKVLKEIWRRYYDRKGKN